MSETQAELMRVVEQSEGRLQDVWGRRHSDSDIIVLGDVRRPECRQWLAGWWPADEIAAAERSPVPFLPYLQPQQKMLAEGGRAQQQAARELRGFAAAGLVPLWVVRRGGHWATCWSPPGSRMAVIRIPPGPQPEDN